MAETRSYNGHKNLDNKHRQYNKQENKIRRPQVSKTSTEPGKGWHTTNNMVTQGVPEPWDKNHQDRDEKKSTTYENWDEKILTYRTELEEKENTRQELCKQDNNEEASWELYDLCKEYLEKNSTDWAKRKEIREQEKIKQERLIKAGLLSRKAKLKLLEKKVAKGMEKIPKSEKERIELEEEKKRRKKIDLAQSKKDL